jgi:hypothetical protein
VFQDYEESTGRTVVRDQVLAGVSGSEKGRYYDGLAKKPDGKYEGIEVKSGTASKTKEQKEFDSAVSSKSPATAKLNGKEIKISSVKDIRK